MPLSNFIFSFNVVMPVFLVVFVGYLLRRSCLDPKTTSRLNWLVFNCALPLMLFRDIGNSDFATVMDGKLILFAVVSTLVIFFITCLIAPKLVKPEGQGAFIQGVFRGNYAIVGLQIITNILGSAHTDKASLIITFIIPLYNILAVLILTIKSSNNESGKNILGNIRKALINIIRNPLIIGIAAGIPFSILHIRLPLFLESGMNSLAGLTTPLALLAIGASINMSQVRNKFKAAAIAAVIKLIVIPLIFLPIAFLIGLSGEQIVILYVMFAAPTAINSFIMADIMGNDSALAANIVLLTTLGSLFTFTLGIFWLRTTGIV